MTTRTPSQPGRPPSGGNISPAGEPARLKPVSREAVERRRILEKELRRIVTHIRKGGKAQRIILFGSLASGRIHPTSDLDVVVVQKSRRAF
jgi:predicted nucleotidyltransferase